MHRSRPPGVTQPVLEQLVQAEAVRGVECVADGRRWHVELTIGMEKQPLLTYAGTPRTWTNLNRLAKFLRERGIGSWTMRAENYAPAEREV